MQYTKVIQEYASQYMETIIRHTDELKTWARSIFIDHPNAYVHIMIASVLILLLLVFLQQISLMRKLDGIDKRDLISLLTIQKYCSSNTRAINELTEIVNENDKSVKAKLNSVHDRMKDVYAGIFKHMNLNRIRRAPHTPEQYEKAEKEFEERDAILREIYTEMQSTE